MTQLSEKPTANRPDPASLKLKAEPDRAELAQAINQALEVRGERSWLHTHRAIVIIGKNRYTIHTGWETYRGLYAQVFRGDEAPESWAYSYAGPVLAEATVPMGTPNPKRVEAQFLRLQTNGR